MIRRADPKDAAAIAAIWNGIIRDTTITFASTEKTTAEIKTLIADRPVWVAGDVTGFAFYSPFRGGTGYAHTMEHTIHLLPKARGAGLGRALMNAVSTHARAEGHHSLIAGISGENANAAKFHQALGFTRVGIVRQAGWKFGRWHDLVLMQKFL